jgi:PKD domain
LIWEGKMSMFSPFEGAAKRKPPTTERLRSRARPAGWLRITMVLASVLAAVTFSPAPAGAVQTATGPARGVVTPSSAQRKLAFFPSIAYAKAHPTSCTTGCTALIYHGGPVQHAEVDYFIFWTPAGYYMPPSYRSGLSTWLSDVAAGNYTPADVFSVAQQYYDTSGPGGANSYVPYAVTAAVPIVDTNPLPASGCTDSEGGLTLPACINDAQIQAEVLKEVTTHGLPQNTNTQYILFTPKNVGSCFTSASTSCSYSQYCGYHGFFTGTTGQIVYANMPWSYATSGCDGPAAFGLGYANASGIDPEVGVLSHEIIETMTDPNLNAWFDGSGSEIGDKCAYNYNGVSYGSSSGLANNGLGFYNQTMHGDQYLMQTEFSNRNSNGTSTGCVLKDTDTQPVVTISVVPASPVHGSSAQFTANVTDPAGVSTVQWNFGDGTTTTGNPVSHTYATAGTKTVTVIVTDNHGNGKKTTKTVTVS